MAVYWLRSFLHIIIIVELSRDSTRRKEGLGLYPDIISGLVHSEFLAADTLRSPGSYLRS